MTHDQVIDFKEAINRAEWEMDLWRFAEIIGGDSSHVETQEKFLALRELSKALSRLDAETLARIINAVQEQPTKVVDHLDGDPHNNSLENLKVRSNQKGAIKLGALFTALVLIVSSLVIGYACGRKAVCEAPASSVQSGGTRK